MVVRRSRSLMVLAVVVFLFFVPTLVSAGSTPERSTHWLSLINDTHGDPTGLTVIVVPPAYVSYNAMVLERGWVGTDPLYDLPSTQATLEAIEYWAWMLDQESASYPDAAKLSFTTKVLGVDATPKDLMTADIVVNTAMVADPVRFTFHLGLGLPTYPLTSNKPMAKCTVWNTGLGSTGAADEPMRLRNLVIHEFGHCLGAGHTGTSLDRPHCSDEFGCFDQHPTDVMSNVEADHRQCLSNLNVQSLDEGYAWLSTTGTWEQHDGETFMLKSDYATRCMPSSMERF